MPDCARKGGVFWYHQIELETRVLVTKEVDENPREMSNDREAE